MPLALLFVVFVVASVVIYVSAVIVMFGLLAGIVAMFVWGLILMGRGQRARGKSRMVSAVFLASLVGLLTWAVS